MDTKSQQNTKTAKVSRLGRGLSSLMSLDAPVRVDPVPEEAPQETAAGFTRIRVDAVGV